MNLTPRVLMIDNARLLHSIVKSRLDQDGIEFHSAYNGSDGLRLARSLQPDLILLDVEMPSPNGFEVCREIKNDSAIANTPVIFLTAATSTQEKVRGLNLGAFDYVTKPFDAVELQARVRVGLRIKELLDLLSAKAMVDGLTGLWNRSYLDQRLPAELAHANRHNRPLSCVMIDIDHFKMINDTHGHGFGDLVLKGVGKCVQDMCRSEDIACRYGGEEFLILARETNLFQAQNLADRIRMAVQTATFARDQLSISVTCSLGIAESTTEDANLLQRADQALYAAKKQGRNRVVLHTAESHAA